LEAATPEIFRNNAFRITGLSVDATARELNKQVERLQIMEELGQGRVVHTSVFALQPPPTLDKIRGALHRLRDPEARLIEEFFWFWPEQFGQREMDAAMHALLAGDCDTAAKIWMVRESSAQGTVAMHNAAIFWHLTGLERGHYAASAEPNPGLQGGTEISCRNAVSRWRVLLTDEGLWETVNKRIEQLNDPRISFDFCRRMRVAMPVALAKIHAQIAMRYAERDLMEAARSQAQLLSTLTSDKTAVETAADLVLASAKSRLGEHSQRAKTEAGLHPGQADSLVQSLIGPSLFLAQVAELFFGDDENAVRDVLDQAVSVCIDCVVAYQRETGNDPRFVDLLNRLRPISTDPGLSNRITKNLQIGKNNIEAARKTPAARTSAVEATSKSGESKSLLEKAGNWLGGIKKKIKKQ
jgi:hypothetical protein